MLELTLLGACLVFIGLILWASDYSDDDDNNDGGLMEPVLVPIPVRHQR
jgi:hypothetical protein|tara:strand:- start:130 stop:276 length:147 start_codon:yes stop_codon:yes gene_type:complete